LQNEVQFPSPTSNKLQQQQEKVILFVCVENAGRSQIAKGFFNRKYAPKGYRAISARTRPSSQTKPLAVQVMKETDNELAGFFLLKSRVTF
jgi:arsenate reductase